MLWVEKGEQQKEKPHKKREEEKKCPQSMYITAVLHFYEIIYLWRVDMFKERLMVIRAGNDFRDY